MAILNSDHLLEQAELLLQTKRSNGLVRQADRRRAISTAYYAVFHFILTAAADQFVGKIARRTPRYALVYRAVDHNDVKNLCAAISRERVDERFAKYAPSNGFGDNIREFASLMLELREKRHAADYDPSHWVKITDASTAVAAARSAILRFEKASLPRRKAFLTLLLFKPRG